MAILSHCPHASRNFAKTRLHIEFLTTELTQWSDLMVQALSVQERQRQLPRRNGQITAVRLQAALFRRGVVGQVLQTAITILIVSA